MKSALLIVALSLFPLAAQAGAPEATVRGYFRALEQKDFREALHLTVGAAQARTQHMMLTLAREAAARHAQVELKVRALALAERMPESLTEPVAVDVTFDIDVIGRKWIFRRLARKLTGTARFLVDDASPEPRIVAILGKID